MEHRIHSDALAFFNELSGRLEIRLTEEAKPISAHLLNRVAGSTAQLVDVALRLQVFEGGTAFRELSAEEWSRIVVEAPEIKMRGEGGVVVHHQAPDGTRFTVRDLAKVVEETERNSRGKTNWLGGIDVHHVYFEGIELDDDDVWTLLLGS